MKEVPLTGYTDRLSARPGDAIAVKVAAGVPLTPNITPPRRWTRCAITAMGRQSRLHAV